MLPCSDANAAQVFVNDAGVFVANNVVPLMEELKTIVRDFFAMSRMLTHVICEDCVLRIRDHFDEKPGSQLKGVYKNVQSVLQSFKEAWAKWTKQGKNSLFSLAQQEEMFANVRLRFCELLKACLCAVHLAERNSGGGESFAMLAEAIRDKHASVVGQQQGQ